MSVSRNKAKLEPVIGIEIHVQLNTESKMFCSCSANHFGAKPNSQTCPVCLGLPGALPSPPNAEAIKKAVLIAKALGCRLSKECRFERKNYFYPDLPKGFQISQHRTAIGEKGSFAGVRIRRAHLEEDAAKLIHESDGTLVDFNRAGVPLVEIVTEPEVESPSQARGLLKELRMLLRHLKVSDADMEKGSMRLEANISMREKGTKILPKYRIELKNINSFNFLFKALEEEITRQSSLLNKGKKVVQETRGYNEETGETYTQRRKEEAADYRYFPEPDLPPITAELLKHEGKIQLPGELRERLEKKYQLPSNYAVTLASDPDLAVLFEETVQASEEPDPKGTANVIVNWRAGNPKKLGVRGLIKAMKTSKEKKHLPEKEIKDYADRVVLDNPHAVEDYKAGKESALNFLLGALMRETKGKVDPNEAREVLRRRLGSKT
jgi:aspartyl-tRNA(Asn)/glutamyl-tRNA(Gln) amidotransferase subunit B